MEQSSSDQIDKKPQNPGTISNNSTGLTVDQLDIEILPVIYDIIRCVEKDPIDNAAKQKESQECSQKILELQKRFESARHQIKQLPGVDYNKEDQLQQLELLKNQLKLKQQLIQKYKNYQLYFANNEQLVQRLSESYPMRRAAQLAISIFYKSKNIAQEYKVEELTPKKFKSFLETFKTNIKQEIDGAKEEFKKRK